MTQQILTIGVMTGNSLDAVDTVATKFCNNGSIEDVGSFSLDYPESLKTDFTDVRAGRKQPLEVLPAYMHTVGKAIQSLLAELEKAGIKKETIAAIGFAGQTIGHNPPSVVGHENAYTLQLGDGQNLADILDIPVIFDFRSDDIMNGGEGAPLAPVHHMHLAKKLNTTAIFLNAGNTGNVSASDGDKVYGWDSGPFNHYPDYLMRKYKSLAFDKEGEEGAKGTLRQNLLAELFYKAAIIKNGTNFMEISPPKSADTSWYAPIENFSCGYNFADILHTAEYFSAYGLFYSLGFLPANFPKVQKILTFGGGWNNQVSRNTFNDLILDRAFVLPEHRERFAEIRKRLVKGIIPESASVYGFDSRYMEARIFADLARCRITGEPFSYPETTGCRKPCYAGIIRFPKTGKTYLLNELLDFYQTGDLTPDTNEESPLYLSRAAKGWRNRKLKIGNKITFPVSRF